MDSRAATAGKVWSFPRFWVLIGSYKKQLVKKFGGRILDLPWLKFTVAALHMEDSMNIKKKPMKPKKSYTLCNSYNESQLRLDIHISSTHKPIVLISDVQLIKKK